MPNYDLGIAHGRVKIDADTRGVTQTEAELAALAAEAKVTAKRLEDLEDALTGYEQAARHSGKSTQDFAADLKKMAAMAALAKKTLNHAIPAFRNLQKVTDNFSSNPGLLRTINAITPKMLLLRMGVRKAASGILDLNRAMSHAGRTSQGILKAAQYVGAFALGYATIKKFGPMLAGVASKFTVVQKAVGLARRGLNELVGAAAGGQTKLAQLSRGLIRTGVTIRDMGKSFDRAVPRANKLFASLATGVTGALLVKQAGRNMKEFLAPLTRIPKKFLAIGAAVVVGLRPLMELGGKGLVLISNLANQLGNAVVTLAGGFLALPGAVAGAITTFGTLKVLASGLKKTFEDVFAAETPEDLAAALDALPEHLRGTGRALADVKRRTTELQEALVDTFNSGLESDIRRMGDLISGPVKNGMQALTATFGVSRSKLVDFLSEKDTVADLNRSFSLTSQVVTNLTNALIPAATGMRDIATVGLAFIRDLSGGATTLTEKFANWAAVNRENGNLMKWMKDGKDGLVDLTKGIVDATQGLWGLLTMFATDSGDNALERFAKTMEKFDKWVQNSKIDGVLKKIGDTVKNLGTQKLDNFISILKELGQFKDVGKTLFIALEKGANSFINTLTSLMSAAKPIIEIVASLTEFFSPLVGKLLAASIAVKGFTILLAPLRAAFMALFGGAMIAKAVSGLGSLASTVGKFGKFGSVAATGLTAVGLGLASLTKYLIGAAAAVVVFKLAFDEGQRQISAFKDATATAAQHAAENAAQIVDAFSADQGIRGKSVFEQIRSDMDEMMTDLQARVDSTPGIMAKFSDFISGGNKKSIVSDDPGSATSNIVRAIPIIGSYLTQPTGSSDELNDLEAQADLAKKAKAAYDSLGMSTEEIGRVASGSAEGFEKMYQSLVKQGDGGQLAADNLRAYRSDLLAIESTFAAAGPGGQQLAAGIQAIAEAGGDASAKLDGLKTALQGLGLLQTSALETAFAFEDAVRKLGEEAASAASGVTDFDQILNKDGGWNTASEGASQLFNVLQPVADLFLRTAVETGNAQDAMAKISPEVGKVAQAFQKSVPEIEKLLSTLGVDQNTVDILVKISGLDEADQKVAQAMLAIRNAAGDGIEAPVTVTMKDPADAAKKIRELLGAGAVTGENSGGFTIPASIIADPNSQRILADAAAKMGLPLNFPGMPPVAAGEGAKLPVTPEVVAPTEPLAPTPQPTQAVPSDGSRGDPGAGGVPAAPVVDTAALDAANGKIEELKGQIAELNANPPKVEVDPAQFDALKAGTETAIAAFEAMKAGIVAKLGEAQNAVIAFAAGVTATLSGLAASAGSYGAQIGAALAAGLASQQAAVQGAADKLAGAVAGATKPGSPTKRGPLSGQGWTGYSGAKLGKAFADSLASQSGAVQNAADKLAGGVANNLNTQGRFGDGPGSKAGEFLGQLKQLSSFGQRFTDVAKKIADSVLGFVKFISDPMGKGTFFGKSAGQAFGFKRDPGVTDDELLQNKLNKSKEKALNAEDQAVADQKKKDAETQAALTSDAIDRVIAGERVAAPIDEVKTDAQKKTDRKTEKSLTATEKAAKSQADFDKTAQQAAADMSAKLDGLTPAELAKVQSGDVTVKTQDQMLAELQKHTPLLSEAIDVAKLPNATEDQSIKSLNTIQGLIDQQGEAKTPAQKQQLSALEGLQSTIKSNAGLTEGDNPIDTAAGIAGSAASVAGDIFKVVDSVIETIGATKDIADTLIRGVQGTADIGKLVDRVQTFIQLGADIAGAVSSVTGTIGSLVGAGAGGDPSGGAAGASAALQSVSQIFGLVQAGLETANAVIDLGQEAAQIIGSYVGDFLGFLTGAGGSQLEGDVKFLLDERTNQLLTYSSNNPQDKRVHDGIGGANNPDQRNQGIGQINVYGGPGSDPRDNTRQMMFQVRAAQFAGATAG